MSAWGRARARARVRVRVRDRASMLSMSAWVKPRSAVADLGGA